MKNKPSFKQLAYWESLKGRTAWNKGKKLGFTPKMAFKKDHISWNKGKVWSEETKRKISETCKRKGIKPRVHFTAINEDHPLWRGDKVSYSGLHYWISRKLGKPQECEHCGTNKAKRFEWANKSGLYTRDLTDWMRLCTSCHRKYDTNARKGWETRRLNYA